MGGCIGGWVDGWVNMWVNGWGKVISLKIKSSTYRDNSIMDILDIFGHFYLKHTYY